MITIALLQHTATHPWRWMNPRDDATAPITAAAPELESQQQRHSIDHSNGARTGITPLTLLLDLLLASSDCFETFPSDQAPPQGNHSNDFVFPQQREAKIWGKKCWWENRDQSRQLCFLIYSVVFQSIQLCFIKFHRDKVRFIAN